MYLASYLFNKFFTPPPSKVQLIKEYEAILEKIEALGNDEDDGDPNRHVEESYMPDAVFFRYKGKKFVTFKWG